MSVNRNITGLRRQLHHGPNVTARPAAASRPAGSERARPRRSASTVPTAITPCCIANSAAGTVGPPSWWMLDVVADRLRADPELPGDPCSMPDGKQGEHLALRRSTPPALPRALDDR